MLRSYVTVGIAVFHKINSH